MKKNLYILLLFLLFVPGCGTRKKSQQTQRRETTDITLKDTSSIHTRVVQEKQYVGTQTKERIVTFYAVRVDTLLLNGDTVLVPFYYPERKEEERDIDQQNTLWRQQITDSIQKAVDLQYKNRLEEKEEKKSEFSETRTLYHIALLVMGVALILLIVMLWKRK